MKLGAYMRANDLDDEAMAALIGDCTAHAVKKWRYAERLPRSEAMRRIQEVTGGQVAPADFFGTSAPESPANASGAPA